MAIPLRAVRGWLIGIGVLLPIVVLKASYAAIAWHTGDPWPWQELVHEAGDRTLLGTVFYFEHAARELPLDLVLGVAVAASALFAFPPRRAEDPAAAKRAIRWTAGALLLTVGTIAVGTLVTEGAAALIDNLAQGHTRPGAPLQWGAHWRYHLLSRAALMLLSLGLAGASLWLMATPDEVAPRRGHAPGFRLFVGAAIAYGVATGVFAPDADPFTDPVFLGHQVRELLTHALVTVPLAFAACLVLADRDAGPTGHRAGPVAWALGAGAVGVVLALYLGLRAIASSAASQGQTTDPILLVAPHFFEHSFSYAVVPLTAALVYRIAASRRT